MKHFDKYLIAFISIFLLAGCSFQSPKDPTGETLSIEPYTLSEQEALLLSMSGATIPQFFTVNGKISEDEDLKYSVEVYHGGKFKEELLVTSSTLDKQFKGEFIAFSI
ncbi:hypothetical protein NCCP2222_34180 [Sporosarcina sp. NCCP-2222]|uniref:hypothetical protein n=1 Tax=Sporosarcina sp. NCCP-2222 TaxID=2935073 RepID=UPI00208B53EE|nr:hypothetical protein [Sporosarcina sp. NCCP-2222]GKV57471.1 hypothetical protein NCCP2222_34180 [Sporosarcina sp. NCCP-2222]